MIITVTLDVSLELIVIIINNGKEKTMIREELEI